MSLQGDKEEYSKLEIAADDKRMAIEAADRLYRWAKSTDIALPPQVSLDLGIVIGRLSRLERER